MFDKLKDISIAKKLYFIVGAMAVLILVELLSLWFAIHTLSSVRALVGAEGLWSKAQKDAVYQLRKYYRTHKEEDYKKFQQFMAVPLGDHTARLELYKASPDLTIVQQGFLQGRVHPDDIDGVISLLSRFHANGYIKKATDTWAKGDSVILQLMPLSTELHTAINSPNPSAEKIDALITQTDLINQELTALEDDFSFTLGEGSRWLENLVLKILLSVAITVEFTGLLLTVLVTRGITKELNEINKATRKIAKGDMEARAKVLSKNEIGQVAVEVNQMTEQLILSNRELEQVAYFASHDLQQPLMTIAEFVKLFQKQYGQQLDVNAGEYLHYISEATSRMQALVRDMLDYSRIGTDKKLIQIDCNKEVQYILADMSAAINAANAKVDVKPLPLLTAYFEIKLLFQNLISNAVKFRDGKTQPVITIACTDMNSEWLFSVKDNGIGIDKKFHERIFTIFQRLHTVDEYEGTGIGLAHCKKVIDLHRGSIWLTSKPGEGTAFYFSIPKQVL